MELSYHGPCSYRDALRAARASDLKVRKAAEEAVAYGQRFHPLESQLEDVTGKQRLQRWMLSVAFVLLQGETGKEGRRIGSFRLTSLVRSRQDTDRTVLKAEHPAVYASVLKVLAWDQLAVKYVPTYEAPSTPVPMTWKAAGQDDPEDIPF